MNMSTIISVFVYINNHSVSCVCPIWKNRMWWWQSLQQSTELCHQTTCACACAHTHHRRKKATGTLIDLNTDSSALITVWVLHEALSCVSVCVWVVTLTPSPHSIVVVNAVGCRLWYFWFGCWQLVLFLSNEHITSARWQSKNIFTCLDSDNLICD